MKRITDLRVPAEQVKEKPVRLKQNAIGPWGLAALSIGITSPAMGLYALWGTMQAAAGPITPLIFLSSMLLILPTAISYALLNSRAPSAGAASTWLWAAVSPTVGYQAGLLMATYFTMGAVACPLMSALFFNDLLRMMHVPISRMLGLYLGVLLATVPVATSCLRGAEASIKTTVRLMVAETVVVLALSATILIVKSSQPGGITLAPLNPSSASHGISGFWVAMILGVLAFSGFDVVSTAAEEASAPRKHVPKAILLTVVCIAVFWASNAWVFTLSIPGEKVLKYTSSGVLPVIPMAQAYWGWGSLIVILTAFTGITAVYISCVQGSSRIIFALARHELLHPIFVQLSGSKRVPRNAIVAVLLGAILLDISTLFLLGDGLDSYNWWANAIVFFAALTYIGVNIASAVFFFRFMRSEFGVFKNLVLPFTGVAVNAYLLYAAFFSALWSNNNVRTGKNVVIFCVALLAAEAIFVVRMRLLSPGRFRQGAPMSVD